MQPIHPNDICLTLCALCALTLFKELVKKISHKIMPSNKFFIACIALAVGACGKKNEEAANFKRPPMPSANVIGLVVGTTPLESNITASGTLLPLEQTELHTEVSGRITSLNLPEGKRVAAGTLLVKLFDEDLQTQLRKLEVQLGISRTTEQRLKSLLDVQGTSQQEYDLAVLQTRNIEAEMELLRVRIRQTELRAPYSGTIGLRQISPGAYVTPATPLATIRDDRQLRLDFSVPEKYGILLKMGQKVQFTIDGSQRKYTATIQASEQSVAADTRDLSMRAIVDGHPSELVPGRFAEVELSLATRQQAILVPTECVIPQAREKKIVVARNGKAQFTTVTTGVRQSGKIEVLSGLTVGDTVVTAGMLFLKPDSEFKFVKVE
jgi:membrane fusion protein, multidrug efflux system